MGKTATGKRKEEEHLKMRQHEWNILLHLNWRSSTAVGRQKVFTLPLRSPLHHPPSLWGNDFGGTASENWAFASSKSRDKHEGFYETLWHYHLHVGSTGQHGKGGPITLATQICLRASSGDFAGCWRGVKTFMP